MIAINIRVKYIGIKITKEKWDLSDLTNDNVPLENYGQYRYRGKIIYPSFARDAAEVRFCACVIMKRRGEILRKCVQLETVRGRYLFLQREF